MINEWYESKKKTYHKHWLLKEGGYAWVLFFVDDGFNGKYHTGTSHSALDCEQEIKWCIATELKARSLL